jgi:hypothetical protein
VGRTQVLITTYTQLPEENDICENTGVNGNLDVTSEPQNWKQPTNYLWRNKNKPVKDRTRLESVYSITAFFAVL